MKPENAYAILQELTAVRNEQETLSPDAILEKLIELATVLDGLDHDRDRHDEIF